MLLRAELFVAVAGASSYLYAEAFPSQELLYWVTGHVHALEFMGGAPAIVVCDNLRSAVTRPHRYEPDVNATYAEMAAHYGMAVIPARAYKPRDKAKAESGCPAGRAVDHRPAPRPQVLLGRRGERRDRRVRGGDQRPAVPEDGRQPAGTVRVPGPPGAAAAARGPVRVRDLAQGPGEHRLPRRGRPPLVLRPLPARRPAGRRTAVGRHRRDLPFRPARRLPRAVVRAAPAQHRPRPHARVAPPARRVDAVADHRLGGQDRPGHRRPGRGDPGLHAPPRAGLPPGPGHHPPGRALRRPSESRRPAPAPCTCAPTPTAASSRS